VQHIDSKTGPGKGVGMLRYIGEKCLTICVLTILLIIQARPVLSEFKLSAAQSVTQTNETVTVNNSITYTGPIYAIAITIHLPEKVTFISSNTNTYPAIQPQKGDIGMLEFVWIKPPESPFKLSYSVKSSTVAGFIQSRITYRRLNEELHYDLPNVQMKL
jgi:hypothetical protein